MLIRLGWRDFKKNFLLNVLVLFLLMAVFTAVITGSSVVLARMEKYRKMEPYLEKKGVFLQTGAFVHGEEKYLYKDSNEVRQIIPNAENVLSVTRLLASSYKGKDVNVWCYSEEVVSLFSPEMEEGRYFVDEDVYADTLKGVVSYNARDIHVGDVIRIENDMIEGNYQEVEIIGVMRDGEELYQPECKEELTKDYRQCFQSYYYEIEDEKPVILINEQQILANQAKGWFASMNYRLSDRGFMKEMAGPLVITYPNDTTEEDIENDMVFLIGDGSFILMRVTLDEVNKNSMRYVFEELNNFAPALICAMVFIFIAAVSAGVVSVKKNMHTYAVYCVCGYQWRKCAEISLITSMITAMISLGMVCLSFVCVEKMGYLSDTELSLGGIQIGICIGIMLFFVVAAWLTPMMVVRKSSVNQVLREM